MPLLRCGHLQVTMLCDLSKDTRSDEPTAVAWSPRACYLTVGTKGGLVHLYDGEECAVLAWVPPLPVMCVPSPPAWPAAQRGPCQLSSLDLQPLACEHA